MFTPISISPKVAPGLRARPKGRVEGLYVGLLELLAHMLKKPNSVRVTRAAGPTLPLALVLLGEHLCYDF